MTKLTVQNVGPISNVEMELSKINVIIGPQSSGKSTIAKIVSYCQWVEKRFILDGTYNDSIFEQLIGFHRLDETYFSENSFFEYESDFIKISYRGKQLEPIQPKKDTTEYKKAKNIYIPAERNFVSAIPNLNKYNETNDNIMSFVYDWYTAKRKFSKQNLLPILNLDIDFYNNEKNDTDVLFLHKTSKEIPLRSGSSGLQSITPLVLIVEYLTNGFNKEKKTLSVNEQDELNRIIGSMEDSRKQDEIRQNRTSYHKTNFIIEEPEQNLFPKTQRDLIYFIFNKLQSEKDHSLLMTTHSPYILYAINNCILGAVIFEKLTDEEKEEFLSKDSWIHPNKVSILEIDDDGTIRSIKNPKTGTVDKHYFNKIMNNIMDEYYDMLNFFEYEK